MIVFNYKCFVVILMMEIIYCQDIPCFKVIQISKSDNNYFGRIEVPTPDSHNNTLKLSVQLSIANMTLFDKDLNNNIRYLGSAEDVIQRRPLVFSLDFPPWNNIPPQVTYIAINNEPLCVAEAIQPAGVYPTAIANLYYILTITTYGNSGINKPTITEDMDYSHSFDQNLNKINNNDIFKYKIGSNQLPNTLNIDFPDRKLNQFNPEFTINDDNSYNRNYYYNTQPTWQPPFSLHSGSQNKNWNSISTTARNIIKPVNTEDNNFDSCGRPKVSSNLLIAHGTDVQMGAHPWIGALFLRRTSANPEFLCGASLITRKLALTAGHCIAMYSNSDLYLTFGRIGINDWFDENAQNTKVEKAELHPDYSVTTSDADIAILRFTKELIFTSAVKPICLWDLNGPLQNIVNVTGVVIGWGKNENYELPQKLQEIRLPVVSEEMCLRAADGFYNFTSNRTFCAGKNDNSGPCNGDSGSGFYFYVNGRWSIRGIVSRSLLDSSGRCDLSQYSVYLDVAKYIQWIHTFY